MDPQASIFGDFSELCANCCVEKGYTTTNLAAERMEFGRKFDGVTKPDCATDLKLPVVKMKPVLPSG